jgi:hypothetical protein
MPPLEQGPVMNAPEVALAAARLGGIAPWPMAQRASRVQRSVQPARSQALASFDTPAAFMAVLLITGLGVLLDWRVLLPERLFITQDARLQ